MAGVPLKTLKLSSGEISEKMKDWLKNQVEVVEYFEPSDSEEEGSEVDIEVNIDENDEWEDEDEDEDGDEDEDDLGPNDSPLLNRILNLLPSHFGHSDID